MADALLHLVYFYLQDDTYVYIYINYIYFVTQSDANYLIFKRWRSLIDIQFIPQFEPISEESMHRRNDIETGNTIVQKTFTPPFFSFPYDLKGHFQIAVAFIH